MADADGEAVGVPDAVPVGVDVAERDADGVPLALAPEEIVAVSVAVTERISVSDELLELERV